MDRCHANHETVEVAVFRGGTWLVRSNTSPTATTVGPFTFGSGTWPLAFTGQHR
jgi:hypothetical protein